MTDVLFMIEQRGTPTEPADTAIVSFEIVDLDVIMRSHGF
jgi:hypothetical protein